MKVLAVIALLAIVANASEDTTPANSNPIPAADVASTADPAQFVGELQDTPNTTFIEFGSSSPAQLSVSCLLGIKLGNPICFGQCVLSGHTGGYCRGRECICVD